MIDEPLFKHLAASFPVDVTTTSGQEASHRVSAEMVYPTFLLELPHKGIDLGESRHTDSPSPEPDLGLLTVNVVLARDKPRFGMHLER